MVSLIAKIVPDCDPISCNLNDLIQLGINVINFMLVIVGLIAVLFFMYGGFLLLTAGGTVDTEKKTGRATQGKRAITAAVVGLIIVLASVIIINTLLTVFTKCTFDLSTGLTNCK